MSSPSFDSLGLDARLLRALGKVGFQRPTPIQAQGIPLALMGKDILARARTGSGKTAAYLLPILHKILTSKTQNPEQTGVKGVVLVPTRELVLQVTNNIKELCAYCSKDIRTTHLLNDIVGASSKSFLGENFDVLVSTPSRMLSFLEGQQLSLETSLDSLVIDEADLVLSYGYEQDVRKILTFLPNIYQTYLMSATMTEEIEGLKSLVLHNPATLMLQETEDSMRLTQQCIKCPAADKFLLLFAILKLKLIPGKCIIFVNEIDRCYRVKLFLEQFSIKSCVLNAELPVNSRYHIIEEYNRGIYDYIIATDEKAARSQKATASGEDEGGKNQEAQKGKKGKKDAAMNLADYGVVRGVDFKGVAAVINFDFPKEVQEYTHRIGRTARGSSTGLALSFVDDTEDESFAKVEAQQKDTGASIEPFKFDGPSAEAFRYRVSDACRAVTGALIREARLKEIKAEILNSEKLRTHFEDNPKDLEALRHDKTLHPAKVKSHMKHVPQYLMPRRENKVPNPVAAAAAAAARKNEQGGDGKKRKRSSTSFSSSHSGSGGANKKKKGDPLSSFKA